MFIVEKCSKFVYFIFSVVNNNEHNVVAKERIKMMITQFVKKAKN